MEPVKVGFVLPFSGTYSLLGESIVNGFKLHIDAIGGEIGGRSVEFIQKDTKADPNTGVSVTKEFLQKEEVDFLVGPVSSAVAAAMAPIVDQQASAVWLNANAGNDNLVKDCVTKYHFRTSFSNWHHSAPMAPWVKENVGDTVFLSFADYAAGQQHKNNFANAFEEAGGTVVGEVGAPLGTSDYSSFLQKIANSDAEAVYSFFAGGDAVNYIKQFHDFGLDEEKTQTGPGFLLSADVLPAQGAAAIGKFSLLHYTPWKESERNNQFVEAYRGANDRLPNVYACQGFDSAQAMETAVGEVGSTEPDPLVDVLEGMEINSPRGFLKLDAKRHDPVMDLDVREVVEGDDGKPKNEVIDTLSRKKVPWSCDF